MKLAVIGPIHPYRGGIAYYTGLFVTALVDAGHEVKVLSFARQYPRFLYPGKSDQDPSLSFTAVPGEFVLDPLNPIAWIKTIQKLRKFQPDMTFFHWWTPFWGPAYWFLTSSLRMLKMPSIFCVHNVMSHENHFWDLWLTKFTFMNVKAYITFSPKESQRLKLVDEKAKIYESRLAILPPACALMDKNAARAALGIDSQKHVILMFGLVRPYKGLKTLLDAIHLLRKEGLDVQLLVVGEFWESEAAYRDQIVSLGLQENVRIENRYILNEELSLFFSAADALVAPYVGGTQSGVVRAAVGYGLPMLVSDRIAGDVDSKYLPVEQIHRAGDAADLARSIRDFLRHPVQTVQIPVEEGWPGLADLVNRIEKDL